MPLPFFKYHPDPVSTGSIKPSADVCACCRQARGYVYAGSFYTAEEKPALCPWCIASGDAAKKYDGLFSDDYPLREARVSDDVIREVCERTPGYNSWQQEVWLTHCDDACEFHGDAEPAELRAIEWTRANDLLQDERMDERKWADFTQNYTKGGDPAVYKFVCRHCRIVLYGVDYT